MLAVAHQRERALEEVICALQDGRDPHENFRIIFERFYAPVYRLFEHKGMAPEDCRDLTQEAFLAVYRSIRDVRDPAQFTAWLFTVARHVFHRELQRRHSFKRSALRLVASKGERDEPDDLDQIPDGEAGEGALMTLLAREGVEQLRTALLALPAQMRRCVQLRVGQDSSYEEIARVLGISVNTVKVHLHRARRELKVKLESYFGRTQTAGGRP